MSEWMQIYLAVWLVLFGAILGSFLNVVVYRAPKKIFWQEARSYCPSCHQTLRALDLVPIVSFLALGGRCRYCKGKISWRYPVVELLCGLEALVCAWHFGFDLRSLFAFCVFLILTALALIDWDSMEIPDCFHLILAPFALWALWLWPEISLTERVIGLFVVSLPMLILTILITDAFGGGDIKLMAVCGFLLGFGNTLLAFFIALLLGGGYAIYLLRSKKISRGKHIAFGPYLCIGVALSLLYGQEIMGWYFSLFL